MLSVPAQHIITLGIVMLARKKLQLNIPPKKFYGIHNFKSNIFSPSQKGLEQ
jgi:hypothetical protein